MAAKKIAHINVSSWQEVLRALPDPETLSYALSRLSKHRIEPESCLATRRGKLVLAEVLGATEDWLEVTRPKAKGEKLAIQKVRRRLEWEIFQ